MLLLADRINVVEGLAQDISHGSLPHYLDERGFNVLCTRVSEEQAAEVLRAEAPLPAA